MQLDEEIRQADDLREAAGPETHAGLAIWAAAPPREEGGRGGAGVRGGAAVSGLGLLALELGLGEALDPGGELAEGGGEEGEGLHGEALAVGGEGHEGVDAPAAASVGIWDAKDIGGGVACEGVAEEDGTAGGRGTRGTCGEGVVDKGGGDGGGVLR